MPNKTKEERDSILGQAYNELSRAMESLSNAAGYIEQAGFQSDVDGEVNITGAYVCVEDLMEDLITLKSSLYQDTKPLFVDEPPERDYYEGEPPDC